MLSGLPLLWLQLQLSFNMTKVMDPTVDPCVDFYEYACGNYKNLVKIRDDKSGMGRFQETDDEIIQELRDLLQAPIKSSDSDSTRMAKKFYRSCVNVDELEKLGLQPLKDLFAKHGGWPVVEGNSWNESKYDWMHMNALLSTTLGGSDIVSLGGSSDFKNSSKRTLDIDQANLGLGKRDFYLNAENKKFVDAYFDFMVATAVQLGAPKELAERELKEALKFETELANISVPDEERRDKRKLYRPMTIKELKEKYPKTDFNTWFRTVGEAGWWFRDSDEINLSGQPYLERLPEVLEKYSKRTIANFQLWLMGMDFVDSLAPSLRENYRKYRKALSGASKFRPRWEECVKATSGSLSRAIGAMYVERYFSDQDKNQLDQMVISVRKAMGKAIDENQWMDSSTKQNAHKKLGAMIQHIAFPSPDIHNQTWVMKNYVYANISEDAYLENQISLAKSAGIRAIKEFPDPINRTEWTSAIAIVNAFYSSKYNRMVFPAGILRPSFYHPSAPDYYNYGHIGAVMGHELTHGFDDQGRQFDDEGNFNVWWTNDTLDEFKTRAQCIVDQYGNITDNRTGLNLNGRNTQGENIADNGGVKLAFKAMKAAREDPTVASRNHDPILPQMRNFTIEQLYFLSYGQVWCDLIRDEYLQVLIVSDPHSPAKYRVNVPLQNNVDFAEAYNCAAGTPMNPVKKCQIW